MSEVTEAPIASLTFVLASQTSEKKSSFVPDKPKYGKHRKTGKDVQTNIGHGKHVTLETFTYKLKAKDADGINGLEGHPVTLTLSGCRSMGWVPNQEINVDLWESK